MDAAGASSTHPPQHPPPLKRTPQFARVEVDENGQTNVQAPFVNVNAGPEGVAVTAAGTNVEVAPSPSPANTTSPSPSPGVVVNVG